MSQYWLFFLQLGLRLIRVWLSLIVDKVYALEILKNVTITFPTERKVFYFLFGLDSAPEILGFDYSMS